MFTTSPSPPSPSQRKLIKSRQESPTTVTTPPHTIPNAPPSVFSFGTSNPTALPPASTVRHILGGKGAGLAQMSRLGLPVPPGFVISTQICAYFNAHCKYPSELPKLIKTALGDVEVSTGSKFADIKKPLLVSVRSGARVSMPGMMDTVLNIGLNDETVIALARHSNDHRFAMDCYRRFIQMFADVVKNVPHKSFEEILDVHKKENEVSHDADLSASVLSKIVEEFKQNFSKHTGNDFPQDPEEQLFEAITAVFKSWNNDRAVKYRNLSGIPHSWGTAVTVQAMVFGNMGTDSATGVAFTRNPATGENEFFGEYLVNAQGEDIVAGIRTPQQLTIAGKMATKSDLDAMEEYMPEVFSQLCNVRAMLENHYHDMQDIEFTVQRGTLYVLQTRNGKRTAHAALRIAVEMAESDLISKQEAILRVKPSSLNQLLHPTLHPSAPRNVLSSGLAASPGAGVGRIVFTSNRAESMVADGEKVVLCRVETSPDDINGMHVAQAVVTARGGMTSHAAVVARGMGRPCVTGASGLHIDEHAGVLLVAGKKLKEGSWVTVDGSKGLLLDGKVDMVLPELGGDFAKLMSWADDARKLQVVANADTADDCRTALRFGADGVGLCRTEHMFFERGRILAMREMILAVDESSQRAAIEKVLPMQRGDFVEILWAMDGRPVTIRLLDPPLHEFLPKMERECEELADAIGVNVAEIRKRADEMKEENPMLGHRGCRVGMTCRSVYEMQVRAIFEAAEEVATENERTVHVEIMVPFVALEREIRVMKKLINRVAGEVLKNSDSKVVYKCGTMIELPRAALRAGEIAKHAEFFSFGTNDLTQMVMGLSRDDAGPFLSKYQEMGLLEKDPFVSLDIEGVGELVRMAVERGRKTRKDIDLCLCGEQGGDPETVRFCHDIGLTSVSCSPFRVPIARLAAAHAALDSDDQN